MTTRRILVSSSLLALTLAFPPVPTLARGGDGPPAVPATRTDLKQFLEASKQNQPRLPLPPITLEEEAKASQNDWSVVNNGRMRKFYLPPELAQAGFLKDPDPAMTLGYPFQTTLFWIASRGNNCTYCMGHQESKLTAAGLPEDRIAALDGDWHEFTPAEQKAFALARTLTRSPQAVTPETLDGLRPDYTDRQILEMVVVTANFNAMNRWTGALKIPQEHHRVYLSPTADRFNSLRSQVAPLGPTRRGPLETASEVAAALEAARHRAAVLPVLDDSAARAVLPEAASAWPATGPLPGWVRLLAVFPRAGGARVALHQAAETAGTLSPTLRAAIAHTAARHDRAWYALDQARTRLKALHVEPTAVDEFDAPGSPFSAPDQAALRLARKLTVDPARVDDADVAALRGPFTDRQVAEIIAQIAEAAFFDRVTETARLPLEP